MTPDVETLCRAYPKVPAGELRPRVAARLATATEPADAAWLGVLLGCLLYDLGERAEAESVRQEALRAAAAAGEPEPAAWAYEMAAWFALVEGRYADALRHARAGRAALGAAEAGVGVQLALQEAKACARLGDRARALAALGESAQLLARLPAPVHADNHFVFDASKWDFFAASIHLQLGDDEAAEALLLAGIARHRRFDGSTDAPMRTAGAQLDLALVEARRGRLAESLAYAELAYAHTRRSIGELRARSAEVFAALEARFPGAAEVGEFAERLRRLGP